MSIKFGSTDINKLGNSIDKSYFGVIVVHGEADFVADYYVSFTDGLDTNDGSTEQTAWKTLAKVQSEISSADAGKTIAFKKGDTWNEMLTFVNDSGTETERITFTSYGTDPNKPIFDVSVPQSPTWINKTGYIWYQTSITTIGQRIKIDGEEALQGNYDELGINLSQSGTDPDAVCQWNRSDQGDGGTYLYIYSTTDPNERTFEWSAESRALYLVTSHNLTFHDIEFKGGVYETITVSGCDNLIFDGVSIGDMSYNGLVAYPNNAVMNQNLIIRDSIIDTKFTIDYGGAGVESLENRATGDGVQFEGNSGGEIHGNYFKNWMHTGSGLSTVENTTTSYIENVKVYNNTYTAPDVCYGASMSTGQQSRDCELYNNLIIDAAGHGGGNGLRNHTHHNIYKNIKTSPIKYHQTGYGLVLQSSEAQWNPYPDGSSCYGNIIENNIFINCESGGYKTYAGSDTQPIRHNIIRNNISYNCGSTNNNVALEIHRYVGMDNKENTYLNNILFSDVATDVVMYPTSETTSELITVSEFNAKSGDEYLNTIANNLADEPLFVDVDNDDYHQLETSPTVNAGTTALSVLDYEGNTVPYLTTFPDIGIYESDYVDLFDYYVANGGDDNANGLTPETAWETTTKALTAPTGSTIGFRGGDEFYGSMVKQYATWAVTIGSYGTGRAIFKGKEDITGWSVDSGNVYVSDVTGKTVYHTLKDDTPLACGRLPKITNMYAPRSNYLEVTSSSSTTQIINASLIGEDLQGAYCFVKGYAESIERRTINTFNPSTGEITLDSAVSSLGTGDLFFVNNHRSLVTTNGDWFYDSANDNLYLYSYSAPLDIEAITLNTYGLHLEGTGDVTLNNVEFNGFKEGAVYIENRGGYRIVNSMFKNCMDRALHGSSISTVLVNNNTFLNLTGPASYISGVGTVDETFTNNLVKDVGLLSQLSHEGYTGTTSQGSGLVIFSGTFSNNRIINTGYHGVAVYGGGICEKNYFENTCMTGHDGADVYTYNHANYPMVGGIIRNNIGVSTLTTDGETWVNYGVYSDDNSKDVTIINNAMSGHSTCYFSHNNQRNSFTYNKAYKSRNDGILVKVDNIVPEQWEDVNLGFNDVYLEDTNNLPLKVNNQTGGGVDFGSSDNNNFYNLLSANSVDVISTPTTAQYTLAGWRTLSSYDANSTDDDGLTITHSQFIYNDSNVLKVISLVGTWQDLSGTQYVDSITLNAWTGEILIQLEGGEPPVTEANLLFKTDFEGTVALDPIDGDYKYFSGSSLGHTFPEDDYFGIWGTSGSGVHLIDGDGGSGAAITNVTAALETTTGHLGADTIALKTEIIAQGSGSTQVTWQFNNFTTDPDEFYMKCWHKVDPNFVVDPGPSQWNWRTVWQYKTENWYLNDGSGARFSIYAMHFGEISPGVPQYFWRMTLDNQVVTNDNEDEAIIWQVDGDPTDFIRDEWFQFEVYFKYRADNTGEAWMKINGVTQTQISNVPLTINNDPFKFILGNSLYSDDEGCWQWMDDIEIWDGIPDETATNLVSNGDFENGSTDWVLGAGWTVGSGTANYDGVAYDTMIYQESNAVAGSDVIVSLTEVTGGVRVRLGASAWQNYSGTPLVFTNISTPYIYVQPITDIASMDDVSMTYQE